jgi:hypothetical protein
MENSHYWQSFLNINAVLYAVVKRGSLGSNGPEVIYNVIDQVKFLRALTYLTLDEKLNISGQYAPIYRFQI